MINSYKIKWSRIILLIIWVYLFILMLQITLKYIPISSNVSFLSIKQEEVTLVPYYLQIFYIHFFSSIFVLFFGIFQFINISNQKIKYLHKISGKFYFYLTVFLAAPSGIFIGFYANGGLLAKIAFVLLGILWLYFTVVGILKIKQHKIVSHKNYMLRSYALALSALTLRAWKVIIVYFFQPNPLDAYIVVAWLGWVPNLIFIEFYINQTKK